MKNMEVKPISIRDFQKYLATTYSNTNSQRSVEYIYSYLTRNCSYLARSIARSSENKDYFLKSISWLFSLSTKFEIDLEDSFRKKFPNVCPYCISSPCICSETLKKPLHYMPEWEIKSELNRKFESANNSAHQKNLALNKAVTNINAIYPANRSIWAAYGSTYHFSRVFEELGEVHEAYAAFASNQRAKTNLEEELADVFAWLISAWGIANKEAPLADALINYYYNDCPVCQNNPCNCKEYSSRLQAIVKTEDLEEFKRTILQLIEISPDKSEALHDIVKSLDTAQETKSTVEAKRVIAQGLEVLDDFEKATSSANLISENIQKLVTTAHAISKAFTWFQ
jgi:NTP pyrophosphatase (non-canonical NTP hydrolase)